MSGRTHRRAGARAVVLLAGSALAVSAAVAPAGASATGGLWRIQKSADATVRAGEIESVSCVSPDVCTAVGRYLNTAAVNATLAKVWNGTSWRRQPTPNPAGAQLSVLAGVSCTAADSCEAVGYSEPASGVPTPFAERWDGTSWRLQPVPSPTGAASPELLAVSCSSARFCEAVGTDQGSSGAATLAEVWRGTSWTVQPTPGPTGAAFAQLEGVSCTSARFCEAVGYSYPKTGGGDTPIAESWDGTSWQAQTIPGSFAGPTSVSCVSADVCEAVGAADAEVWNGASWSAQSVPSPTGASSTTLSGVSCVSAGFCEAVGDYLSSATDLSLGEVWNGTSWAIQPTPSPATAAYTALLAVSCTATSACEAGGASSPEPAENQVYEALAQGWNGSSWTIQPIVTRGATSNSLNAVSCVGAGFCEAVGSHTNVVGDTLNLAEARTGTSWKVQATPQPPHSFQAADATLDGVSCVSADFCEAVGYSSANHGPAAMMWNGTSWQAQTIPGSAGAELDSVSCVSADFCEAVGGTQADAWNGTSWSTQSLAAGSPTLGGVSCVSADFCEATGGGSGGHNAEVWHGSDWSLQATPTPPNGDGIFGMGAPSCVSADFCAAVGGYQDLTRGGQEVTLAEMWNGTTWAIERTANPKTSAGDSFNAVSCTSATACIAVGGYSTDASASDFTLAQVWNGTSWSAQRTPRPGPASPGGYLLAGVSCGAPGACTAAGATNPNALPATLVETGD